MTYKAIVSNKRKKKDSDNENEVIHEPITPDKQSFN